MILIAVALFAALSYAVTNSSRGGGQAPTKEGAKAKAAMLYNYISEYQRIIMQQKLINGYVQLQGNKSAGNTSGTCYNGATGTTPCKTIGLFNPAVGGKYIPVQSFPQDNPVYGTIFYYFSADRYMINGVDVGTSKADMGLWIDNLSREICFAYNRIVNPNSDLANDLGGVPGTTGSATWDLGPNVNQATPNLYPAYAGTNVTAKTGCLDYGTPSDTYYSLYAILEEN